MMTIFPPSGVRKEEEEEERQSTQPLRASLRYPLDGKRGEGVRSDAREGGRDRLVAALRTGCRHKFQSDLSSGVRQKQQQSYQCSRTSVGEEVPSDADAGQFFAPQKCIELDYPINSSKTKLHNPGSRQIKGTIYVLPCLRTRDRFPKK